ncbi:hypothetical protein UFOVP273_89 [uncultured Caudovirales phage]|uniref:Uncharacterized protein n=1 Tax=uncultured Caudovirales phage TaxID=2100421 RepID=A0A6J5LNA5_9CAUD|nr:hypothetical protein UFOVP273_89 [uncultured Caudovirales phage]
MIKVYAKLSGKLAHWQVETDDHVQAIATVRETLPYIYERQAVLALIEPKPIEFNLTLNEVA